jgi:hypothetical protein
MGDQNAAGGLPSRDDRQAEIAAISHSEGSQRAGGTNKADDERQTGENRCQ